MNKRNKSLIILGVIWLFLALLFIVLSFALAGSDIIAWFGSKWAMIIYTFLGIYALAIIIVFVLPSIMNKF